MDAPGPGDSALRRCGFPRRPRGGHHAHARPGGGARGPRDGHRRRGDDQGPLLKAKALSPHAHCPAHVRSTGSDGANGRLGTALRDLRSLVAPLVHDGPGRGHRARTPRARPPRPSHPRPRDRPRDSGDEPRETRVRRARNGYLPERDQEGKSVREGGWAVHRIPCRQRPRLETGPESGRRDRGPRRVPRSAGGQTARLRPDGASRAPPERVALPEMLLGQGTGHMGTAPDRGIRAAWIFPWDLRDSIRCRDRLLRERQAAAQGAVRDVPTNAWTSGIQRSRCPPTPYSFPFEGRRRPSSIRRNSWDRAPPSCTNSFTPASVAYTKVVAGP